jgi:regulatory protein
VSAGRWGRGLTAPRGARRPDALPGSRARLGGGQGQGRGTGHAEAEAVLGGTPGEGGPATPSQEPKRPRGTARDRALHLLSFRARSRRELRDRLLRAGYEREEVEEALAGLEAAGLVDDERFADAVVEHHATVRLAGTRAVRAALLSRGLERDVADRALGGLGDDAGRARELAERRASRLGALSPEVAFRRLVDFLIRRGHSPAVARSAAAAALQVDADGS